MTRNERWAGLCRPVAFDGVQVRVAYTGSLDFDDNAPGAGGGALDVGYVEVKKAKASLDFLAPFYKVSKWLQYCQLF